MSTFSLKDYNAENYKSLRPNYPESFFKLLKDWVPLETAVDIGCGPGTASMQLAKYYNVTAIDPSERMIETANKEVATTNLEFKRGTDADLTRLFKPSSVGLILAAQSAHWFDLPKFWDQAHQVLQDNGGVALIGYSDPHVVEYPHMQPMLLEFSYGNSQLGPFWDNGRQTLANLYRGIQVPSGFELAKLDPLEGNAPDYPEHALTIERNTTVNRVLQYLTTYSSYHNWKAANPNQEDIVQQFAKHLQANNVDLDRKVTVRWNTALLMAKKLATRR